MNDIIPWREDDWQARDLRLRDKLNSVGEYLLSKRSDPKAVEALADLLFVQSCLKLDREADALARAETTPGNKSLRRSPPGQQGGQT